MGQVRSVKIINKNKGFRLLKLSVKVRETLKQMNYKWEFHCNFLEDCAFSLCYLTTTKHEGCYEFSHV
jgi:hypothetical protein